MNRKIRILILEDRATDAELMLCEVRRAGYEPEWKRVDTEPDYLAQLHQGWEVILADYTLPQFTGLRALELLKERRLDIPFIIVSGTIGEDQAVAAMKAGANDYLMKDRLARLGPTVERALREAAEGRRRRQAEESLRDSEVRYRRLFESAKEGVLILDAETGMVVDVNPFLIEMLGLSHEQFVGKTIWELGFLKDIVASQGKFEELQQKEYIRYEDTMLETADGRRVEVEFISNVYLVDHEKVMQCNIRDITERKRAEAALREEETRYRTLFQQSPDGVLIIDTQTGLPILFNEVACRQLGYSREEFARLRINDYEAAERPEETNARIEKILREGRHDFETQHRTKTGDLRNVRVTIQTIHLSGRSVFHCIFRDITRRRRAEAALRESDARYRALFQNMFNGFAYCRMQYDDHARPVDFVYLGVNEAFERLTGLTNVVGKPVSEVIPGIRELSPELFETYGRVASTGIPETFEFDFKSQRQWLAISVYSPEKGNFIAVFDDITERKQAEAELRLQSAALNAAANAIVITDPNGTIEWINAAFTSLTGYGAEETIGKNLLELVKSGVHDQAFYKGLWNTLLAGQVWRGETTNRRKDGSLYPVEQTITPVKDASGEITHFIAVKRDLTEQRRLEAQFLQAQKMETVGQLAGGIAHDFNNLLTVINGMADLALMNLKEGDPLRTDLQDIRQAGERAALLTRQLLAFSRKQAMKFDVVNLNTLVADLQGMLQRVIREDIDLVVVPAKDVGSVMADPGQIEQVVMNLAVNAKDAMPNGGRLTIEIRNVELDEAYAAAHPSVQPGPHVMLAISDTGVGMNEAIRTRIFEPFFTTKAPGKGTGLGLSMVYGIVKQSGGNIWVYSEPGKGASFKIYLPRVEEVAHKVRPAPTVTSTRGTETILVVEDDTALRHLAARILQSAGYVMLTAGSGGEALSLLERHDGPVHLVLTDMVMPGLSGRDLATRLKHIRPQMKVLYTSGYPDDATLHRGLLDEATHFIGKPYNAAELTRKVREVLDT